MLPQLPVLSTKAQWGSISPSILAVSQRVMLKKNPNSAKFLDHNATILHEFYCSCDGVNHQLYFKRIGTIVKHYPNRYRNSNDVAKMAVPE